MHATMFKYFLAVAESGSIRQAAAELHISPSALSRQIQNLEHSFKTPLFDRRVSGMHLTEEGHILALHMQRTVREMELARTKIDGLHGMVSGTIRYATIEGATKSWLFPAINTFQKQHPGVVFEGQVIGSEAVYAAISADQVDLGIAMETELPNDINIIERFDTRFKAVMAPDHPLAKTEQVTLRQLSKYRLAMLSSRFQTRQLVNTSASHQGLTLNVVFELDHIEMLKFYIQANDCITILPAYAIDESSDNRLATADIPPGELPPCATLLCRRHDRHLIQAAERFIEQVRARQGKAA